MRKENIKNLLVHTCCAPCTSYVFEKLIEDQYSPTGYFYNPNIHPQGEYTRRLEELLLFAETKNYRVIVKEESEGKWFSEVAGFEDEKEGGKRCEICFRLRLEETATFACQNNYDGFTTVMTVSPHKNAEIINKIGRELENKYGIFFLEENFKKNNGFKRSLEISQQYNLYRQNYCGCKFSIRNI